MYSALLSTGAEEHNCDGSDDLTNLCMVVGDVVASAHTRLSNLKSYLGQVLQENTRWLEEKTIKNENHKWMARSDKSIQKSLRYDLFF